MSASKCAFVVVDTRVLGLLGSNPHVPLPLNELSSNNHQIPSSLRCRAHNLSNIKVDCTYDMLVIIESLDVVVFISVAL
jgi:hypothetical protein